MKKQILIIAGVFLLAFTSCKVNKKSNGELKHKDVNGITYETYENDPTGLRLYTLENGLKVYLSKNEEKPKIQTFIAVRAGSSYDPKESTGLAHYLEHMVFKGTHKIGTQDWEKEKVFLNQISDLYEKHRAEKDVEKKRLLYKQIDSISYEASKLSVANEYDKLVGSLGATDTNAHTSFEETIYKNIIPSNELDKWIDLESERFSTLVLRLFHTELEAVFEEFNQGQDSDSRKSFKAMFDGLFPTHTYGQQTVIGKGEHLKNPSMVDIHNYFNKYYVPNNMAIVLVGDLEFDKTIKKINETFGKMKRKDLTHPVFPKEQPIKAPIVREVFGPKSEKVTIAFRTGSINSDDKKYVTLCDMILSNGQAGLIDLNLNQKQLVQSAGSSSYFLNDYGLHSFYGNPKAGQSLDQVKDLLLGQIEKIKKGEFDEWMIEAVINDMKLSKTKQHESSTSLATAYYNAFIHRVDWQNEVNFFKELKKISKKDLVAFANKFYKDNYVVVYKRKGEDKNTFKVENPGITPIVLNRDKTSEFTANFLKKKSEGLKPKFIDYKKQIKKTKTKSGLEVTYVKNETNDLFNLSVIFDMGNKNMKNLSTALGYFDYLGTDKYSSVELKKEFYKLGVNYSFNAGEDKTYLNLSGLNENLEKGLELIEHLLSNLKVDEAAYVKYIESIAKSRSNFKTGKTNVLWAGLVSYAKFGENSANRDIYQLDELKAMKPQDLVALIKDIKNYKQRVFYYGKSVEGAVKSLDKIYKIPSELKDYPQAVSYKEVETGGKVYFTHFDMVQTEMVMLSKGKDFNSQDLAVVSVFNSYFGSGLSSIVFQEIRESKSLAYSAFATYQNPSKKDKPTYVVSYVGTQANKLEQAVDAMMKLMNDMPEAQKQFEAAKISALKKIASQRITKSNIFWSYENLQKLGFDNDNRESVYNNIKKLTMEDMKKFFNENIKGSKYTIAVIGNRKNIDKKLLSKLGEVKELDVDYLFNFKN